MAQNARNTRIAAAYAEIKKLIDSGSYPKIIRTSNKIINDDHNQPEAWQCRVVAFIQMEQFKDAANAIAKAPNKQKMQFELAYCLYRLNDVSGALATLEAASDKDSPRGKELRAQILYRLEQYNDCYAVYRELVRSTDDDLDMERSTNLAAVQVHRTLHKQCELPAPPGKSASYEQWYNSGSAAAAAGETGQALERLTEALKQCTILLQEEGAEEEELQQEQAIIRVQKGYVLQLQGRDREAAAEYNAVLQHPVSDPALLAILHNNTAAASTGANVFEMRKKMKATLVHELEHKLTSTQREELSLNNCILAYQCQQALQEDSSIVQECERLLNSSKCSPRVRQRALLVLAASLARAGKLQDALQRLHDSADKEGEGARLVRLAAAQLRLMKSDVSGGVEELSKLLPSDRYRPGVVASIVTLLNAKKQKEQVAETFKEAAAWHQKNKGLSRGSVEQLLRRASEYYLQEGSPQSAAAALEQLRISSPDNAAACLPSLIHAYSQFDSAKAQKLARELPDLPPAASGGTLDADALEASLGPKYFLKAAQKQEDGIPAPVVAAPAKPSGRVKPRKKKRRKTVLPKSYVAGVEPDPERWLPRWQRKNTGRRRRDRRKEKDVGRGTQGGTGDATDKYDITKNPGQYKSNTIQQQPEPAGPRRNMPKKKASKKK